MLIGTVRCPSSNCWVLAGDRCLHGQRLSALLPEKAVGEARANSPAGAPGKAGQPVATVQECEFTVVSILGDPEPLRLGLPCPFLQKRRKGGR